FGIMKAGGAYVPLDPDYPKDRILYMLKDSGSTHLLAQKERLDIAENYEGNVILLDDIISEAMKADEVKTGFKKAKPENLAYMIYTSGSTGKPKGVEITHAGLMNLLQQITIEQSPTEQDVYALFSSFCFDASVHDIFIPYTCGASLYIFPADSRQDVMKVCEVFERESITITTMPTQMGELVVDMLSDNAALRIITLGGEKFKRFHGGRKFIMFNGYGPTENTVSTSSFPVDKEYRNIPIGKSHINVRSYILDDKLQRVAVGAPGELCLSGRQLARGYHNLPEKTAAAFVANPYANDPDEARLYHTGDMVRKKGDGNMEYIGRIDSQVKIRGYRVELGEIEGAILSREGVGEAAVIAVETNGVVNLIAYYTGSEYEETEWKTYLAPLIPEYMMPAFILHIDAMPVTPGGKIDKKALPKPEIKNDSKYVAPQNPVQKKLCEIFAKALGLEKIGIEDDFFAMGGSSLAASKVAVMCLAEKIEVVYADIFKYPTVKELSGTVSGGKEEEENRSEFADYDYGKIDMMLSANDIRNVDLIDRTDIGDILLTGTTGFLGIHVLKNYLDNQKGTVYCLVRKGRLDSPEKRLKNMLMYYFGNTFDEMFGTRIRCIDGDITDENDVMSFAEYDFDTLINCAACVKHFSAGDLLEKINVTGVKHLVRLCREKARRLIHISTVSVAGEGMDGTPPADRKIREKDLYFGQSITNEYIRTKFLAERIVLQAAAEGLDAKVIRVGNLMSRDSDGEFQINFITNAFLRSLRGYKTVGVFPLSSMGESTEFSPIDSTAEAVLTLAGTGSRFTVFHATNSHRIYMSDVIRAMREYGFEIDIVPDEEFVRRLNDYAKEHEGSESVSGLIAYASHDANNIYGIDYDNTFTVETLYRLGYLWPITDNSYLKNAILALDGLNFFEKD
ncbi:MAG: amino acid adenylation domain-containing protein, partial [Oscillospiraceae bacterium]|nr:amino acid adenylation domain-containing protein [Oscillospiraceae bacterium]